MATRPLTYYRGSNKGKMECLYPFHKDIRDSAKGFDDRGRKIDCVTGNNGKSSVASLAALHGLVGVDIPPILTTARGCCVRLRYSDGKERTAVYKT